MRNRILIFGIAMSLAFPTTVNATGSNQRLYESYVDEIATEYCICPELVKAIIFHESSWNPNVKSSANCVGLMQVNDTYSKDRMNKLGVTDLYDPYSNILVGVDLLAELAEKYEPYEALVAYNCGEYSKTFKKLLNNPTMHWQYAEDVLSMSAEMERIRDEKAFD